MSAPNNSLKRTGGQRGFDAHRSLHKSGVALPPPLSSGVGQPSCIIVGHSVACAGMDFELVGEIAQIETIASGSGVRDRARLRRHYGLGRWRKLKGIAASVW
jgi:hypothetical protein